MHLKMASGKWGPFCLSLNVLNVWGPESWVLGEGLYKMCNKTLFLEWGNHLLIWSTHVYHKIWIPLGQLMNKEELSMAATVYFQGDYFAQGAIAPPWQCSQCNATFKNKRNLQHHQIRKHGAPRIHKCPQCGRSYALYKDLDYHMKRTGHGLE